MEEEITSKKLVRELEAIKKDLNYLKEHMIDVDNITTEDDYNTLNKYRKDKKSQKLTSHKDLKKELNIS